MTLWYVDVDEVGLGGEGMEVGAMQLSREQGTVSLGEAELTAIGGDRHLALLAEEVGEGVTLCNRQDEVLRQAEDRGAEVGASDKCDEGILLLPVIGRLPVPVDLVVDHLDSAVDV